MAKGKEVTLDYGAFYDAMYCTLPVAELDEPAIHCTNSVYIDVRESEVVFVSTDGHIMSVYRLKVEQMHVFDALFPAKQLKRLLTLLGSSTFERMRNNLVPAEVKITPTRVLFVTAVGRHEIKAVRKIAFPPYQRVIAALNPNGAEPQIALGSGVIPLALARFGKRYNEVVNCHIKDKNSAVLFTSDNVPQLTRVAMPIRTDYPADSGPRTSDS